MSVASPEKLRLVLKLLSMSNTGLAAELGVDKSVVSRWLSGAARPSSHNLSLLTQVVAGRRPGFRTLDWERDHQGLAELFGVEGDAPLPGHAGRNAAGLDLVIWDQAVATTAQRGRAYEGFYRILRPTDIPAEGFAYDYSYVRLGENGLLRMSLASFGAVAEGWVLPLHNQLYMVLSDATSGAMTFAILNGLASTKVEAMDGIALGASHDPGRTPTALAIYCERVGDVTGDAAQDERTFDEWARTSPQPAPGDIDPSLIKHILPDFGPAASDLGGAWMMQMKRATSLSRSAPPSAQIAAGVHRTDGPEPPRLEAAPAPFREKLRLVLKLLTLSSAQLAAAVEVDKSVVSRWLGGGVEPSTHNLVRLTAVIAARTPGFTMLDWERPPESLAQLFGADLVSIPGLKAESDHVLTLPIWDQILSTAALRGSAYEGFFRTTRPSVLEPGGFIIEYGVIQPHPCGLYRFRLAGFGATQEGWMLPLHDQINFIAADKVSGVLLFGIFNGVGAPKVDVVDGLTLSPSVDVGRSPTAMPVVSEHVEALSGDADKDEARFLELGELKKIVPLDAIDARMRKRLLRDGGLTAHTAGGDLLLQMPLGDSLARARTFGKP